jgi:hypothetical protein
MPSEPNLIKIGNMRAMLEAYRTAHKCARI